MADPFYIVSGGETAIKSQYLTGNIPSLFDRQVTAGILLGITLAFAFQKLGQMLHKRSRTWRSLTAVWQNVTLTMLFLLTFEMMLHLPYYSPQRMFVPDPLTFWKANPQAAQSERGRRTNMVGTGREAISGIFDQEHPRTKPADTFRIMFLGDSQAISAFRRQYDAQFCYPKVLQRTSRSQGMTGPQKRRIETINGAISGYSSWQGLLLFKSELAAYSPDVVVEAFGYHDSNEGYSTDRSVITDRKSVRFLRSVMYRSHLCLLIRSALLRFRMRPKSRYAAHDIDCTERVPLPEFSQNIRSFAALAHKQGFRLVLLPEPVNKKFSNLPEQMAPYYSELRRLAKTENILLIDAPAAFDALPPEEYGAMFADSIHFTPYGHDFMASLIQEALLHNGLLESESAALNRSHSEKK